MESDAAPLTFNRGRVYPSRAPANRGFAQVSRDVKTDSVALRPEHGVGPFAFG